MNRSHPARESDVSYEAQTRSLRGTAPVTVLSSILFLSGIGALIFETLWLRLSGLAFGNSVWAAALILSSFMAGLALGNAIAASSRIRRWRPLHLYALLEVLVALLGCTIVFGLPALGELLRPMWQMLWNYQPALLGLRFIVSFLILLVPTTAMGLTLPVLIEDPMLRQTNFGRAIGFLYGSNTLGAVVGAVLGEGYLIAAFGLRGTSLLQLWRVASPQRSALLITRNSTGDTACALFLSERFRCAWMRKISAPMAYAFRQLWNRLHPSCAGSDLVPVSAIVCCFVADRFRNHARGCVGRNRVGRHCCRRDSSPLCPH